MARRICIRLPDPPSAGLEIVIPGVGAKMKAIQDLAIKAYNACNEARDFIRGINPLIASMGLPLCILGCVNAIIQVFDPNKVPPIDPGAIPNMIEQCKCLTSFTPLAYCSMAKNILKAIQAVLNCIIGLMGDIAALEAQIAGLFASGDADDKFAAECLVNQSQALMKAAMQAFEPITLLVDSMKPIFDMLGVTVAGISEISGGSSAEVIASCEDIKAALDVAIDVLDDICP